MPPQAESCGGRGGPCFGLILLRVVVSSAEVEGVLRVPAADGDPRVQDRTSLSVDPLRWDPHRQPIIVQPTRPTTLLEVPVVIPAEQGQVSRFVTPPTCHGMTWCRSHHAGATITPRERTPTVVGDQRQRLPDDAIHLVRNRSSTAPLRGFHTRQIRLIRQPERVPTEIGLPSPYRATPCPARQSAYDITINNVVRISIGEGHTATVLATRGLAGRAGTTGPAAGTSTGDPAGASASGC